MIFFLSEIIFTLFSLFLLIFIIIDASNLVFRKIPSLSSSSKVTQSILKILEKKRKGIFVDLGCGRGKILIAIKKKYPEMEVIGYENWPTQFFLAKMTSFLYRKKLKIFFQDLFLANLRKADIVFCYLTKDLIERLEKKFELELKEGALVLCSTFPLPHWKPNQEIITNEKNPNFDKIFIYEKRRKVNRDQKG